MRRPVGELRVRATSFARTRAGDVPGVVVFDNVAEEWVLTEPEALALLDRLMDLLRVPSWVQKIVRTFARGLLK